MDTKTIKELIYVTNNIDCFLCENNNLDTDYVGCCVLNIRYDEGVETDTSVSVIDDAINLYKFNFNKIKPICLHFELLKDVSGMYFDYLYLSLSSMQNIGTIL